eukprot:m.493346 g.493346  ORF g.493346 m.493346 type:complete len:208 (-) comp36650_c0_seq1:27-650(-)
MAMDLYEDLVLEPVDEDRESYAEIKTRMIKAESLVASQAKELDHLRKENTRLSAHALALKKNVSCLYKTAKGEVDRKDQQIAELRTALAKSQGQNRSRDPHTKPDTTAPRPSAQDKPARAPELFHGSRPSNHKWFDERGRDVGRSHSSRDKGGSGDKRAATGRGKQGDDTRSQERGDRDRERDRGRERVRHQDTLSRDPSRDRSRDR